METFFTVELIRESVCSISLCNSFNILKKLKNLIEWKLNNFHIINLKTLTIFNWKVYSTLNLKKKLRGCLEKEKPIFRDHVTKILFVSWVTYFVEILMEICFSAFKTLNRSQNGLSHQNLIKYFYPTDWTDWRPT